MKFKISIDFITNIMEVVGAGFVVAGIGFILGTGACLIATGIAVLTLSFFASLGDNRR